VIVDTGEGAGAIEDDYVYSQALPLKSQNFPLHDEFAGGIRVGYRLSEFQKVYAAKLELLGDWRQPISARASIMLSYEGTSAAELKIIS